MIGQGDDHYNTCDQQTEDKEEVGNLAIAWQHDELDNVEDEHDTKQTNGEEMKGAGDFKAVLKEGGGEMAKWSGHSKANASLGLNYTY